VWVQNESLEFAHVCCVLNDRSITGKLILPFKTTFPEGIEINRPEDISRIESLVSQSTESLPTIKQRPFD